MTIGAIAAGLVAAAFTFFGVVTFRDGRRGSALAWFLFAAMYAAMAYVGTDTPVLR